MTGTAEQRRPFEEQLTAASLITITYMPPPAHLADIVDMLYFFRCDEADIRDIQPAARGQLMVFLKGAGEMIFEGDRRRDPSHPVSLLSPLRMAAPFIVQGPFHCFGASLSPLGWARLTRLNAADHADRLLDASLHLPEQLVSALAAWPALYRAGKLNEDEMAAQLAILLPPLAQDIPAKHAQLIDVTCAWFASSTSPQLADLYDRLPFGERQAQRLILKYFGLPPKPLLRKYRAILAATVLGNPFCTTEMADAIADSFYDQSHMIREIRLFAGRTPARLGDADSPILNTLLDERHFPYSLPKATTTSDAD